MLINDNKSLKEQIALLPMSAGCYLFENSKGEVIYVGKAKHLRNRVRSYFVENRDHSAKVRVMVRQIASMRHIVVDSETDALLLENSLIKTLQPRYNILLKDGREGCVVEAFENKAFIVDVGSSPKDWDTISVTIDEIEKVID